MRLYTVTTNAVTPVVTNDVLTLTAAAGLPVRVKRVRCTGEASASTVMRTVIQRSTGGGEQLSIRNTVGTGLLSVDVEIEEA